MPLNTGKDSIKAAKLNNAPAIYACILLNCTAVFSYYTIPQDLQGRLGVLE